MSDFEIPAPITDLTTMTQLSDDYVRALLAGITDPYTDTDLVSLGWVRGVGIDGPRVSVDLRSGYPLDGIRDNLVTVARADHPLFKAPGKRPQDYPLAAPLPQGSLSAQDQQIPGNQRIASDNYPLLVRVALSSDCICRGPWYVFERELEREQLREVSTRRSAVWQSACLLRPESEQAPLVKFLVRLLVEGSKQYGRRR